jgi:exonuclease III
MAKFLRIALWNANGLTQHKDEIQFFLQQNKIDILLISETHFTTKSYFKIPHYNVYFTNHPNGAAHAGTALLVKQTISHYELPTYEEDFLQATSICVRTLPYELTVTAVYCPPKYNLKKDHYELFFNTLGPRFLAGGDYNSKHSLRLSYNYHQRQRVIQPLARKELLLLTYRTPNLLAYGPHQTTGSFRLLRHKRDFFTIHGYRT